MVRIATLVAAVLLAATPASRGADAGPAGAEPAYCDPAAFARHEIPDPAPGVRDLVRLRAFRLGRVVLAGLAVGDSDTAAVKELALRFAPETGAEGYCTWYVNDGDPEAARVFNFRYLPHPGGLDKRTGPVAYLDAVGGAFSAYPVSLLTCARERGYIAVGCDAMKHRGPTLFGMVLAFSGCTPEHAAAIANGLWGLNGVRPEVRLEIVRAAYDLGRDRAADSARLADLFSR